MHQNTFQLQLHSRRDLLTTLDSKPTQKGEQLTVLAFLKFLSL